MVKKLLFFFLLICIFQFSKAQSGDFITVWKPGNTQNGVPENVVPSTDTQIWLPIRGNNFTVYWEEIGYPAHNATITNITSALQTLIDFGAPLNPDPVNATYRVKVRKNGGSFNNIRFVDSDLYPFSSGLLGDSDKILDVEQWGTAQWITMKEAFRNCRNLDVTATDIPDLSNVSDMSNMFGFCFKLVGNSTFKDWDISNVTNLHLTFTTCYLFNQPIGSWNTSNVTNMHGTFNFATSFNSPLAGWDTSNVEDATSMFFHASAFNQPIGNWDLSKNVGLEFMFAYTNFNQPIGSWDTSEVVAMHHMFLNNPSFNQDIGNWDTGKVIETEGMFLNATSFDQNLENWNLSSLEIAESMFENTDISCVNYSKILRGWASNINTPGDINLGNVAPATYSTGVSGSRNQLISNGWIISGDNAGECNLLGISDHDIKNQPSVYPNPASDFIYVKNMNGLSSYKIFDTTGRIILENLLHEEKINIGFLIKGNYILQITTKEKIQNFKFIKN